MENIKVDNIDITNQANEIDESDKIKQVDEVDDVDRKNVVNNKSDSVFWINDPMVLFKESEITQLWPLESMNKNEKLNAISRLVILLTILGFILTQSIKIIITGFVTLGVFVFLYYNSKDNVEGFCNMPNLDKFYLTKAISKQYTQPSTTNPLMNVMLPEIQDDPNRKSGAPSFNPLVTEEINRSTKVMIEENFDDPDIDKKLFNDLGDNIEFEQSMRQFYSTPSTTIPNNQKDFAQFCYGDMVSCKEGHNLACVRNNPQHINP